MASLTVHFDSTDIMTMLRAKLAKDYPGYAMEHITIVYQVPDDRENPSRPHVQPHLGGLQGIGVFLKPITDFGDDR